RFKKNGFVAVSKKGLYHIKHDGSFSLTPLFKNYSNPDIRGITEDADGTLWIATLNHGVFAAGINGTIHLGKAEGMSSDFASSVFCDAENNIWVGTFAGGLHKISPRNITSISSAEGLTNEFIFSLAEAKNGDLWAGSYGGGVFKISPSELLNFTTKDGLNANIVRSVLVDKKQNIWIASFAGGLNMYDGKSLANISKKYKVKDPLIHALLETKDGNILAGGSTGITMIGKDSITIIPNPPDCANSYIRSFALDSVGGLWVAYDYAGIAYYKDGKYTLFSGRDGYGYKAVRSLYIDKGNKLWITSSEGLSLYSDRKFFHFSAVPELNQLVYQIVEDDFGDFWIPTNQGILRISRENLIQFSKGKIRELPLALFNKADGMLSSECNGGNLPAGIKLHTGEIVFPTLKGITVINPAKIKKQTSFAPLHISFVKGDEKSYFPDENIKLPRGTRRVEITFASLTFRDPQRIKYQYKLSNIDSRFQTLLGSRNIIYNHLPAGSYELILYTSNDAGEWAPVPLHFRFSIEPYFYETTFFWLCVAFIVFTIFTLLYFKRVNVLKRRGLMLQKLVDQKTESLNTAKNELEVSLNETLIAKQNLQVLNSQLQEANAVKTHLLDVAAHDLRNPLNAIKGFSQILHEDFTRSTEENKLLEHINQASSHMLLLINDLLETSHIGSGKLTFNLKMVDLSYSLKKIIQRNRFIAKKKGQEIFHDIPNDVQVFSDERRVDEIFDNLISNAIKYSPFNTEIHVGVAQSNSHVTVEIKDNGPGLSEADMKRVFGKFERLSAIPTAGEASTGLGLAIVKDLVTLLNGSVSVQSEHGKGASFFVTLPVSDMQQK
ncbi:MAG: hypothetical protein HY965_05135, partial [Ignavibacteriales bacterium]|nr:hypothetical protein [Ignavibacteriales bacterium]